MKKINRPAKKPSLPSDLKLLWRWDGGCWYAIRGFWMAYVQEVEGGHEVTLSRMTAQGQTFQDNRREQFTVEGTLKQAQLEAERLLSRTAF